MKRKLWIVLSIIFPIYVIWVVRYFIITTVEFSSLRAMCIAGVIFTSIVIEIVLILKVCFSYKTHPYSYE